MLGSRPFLFSILALFANAVIIGNFGVGTVISNTILLITTISFALYTMYYIVSNGPQFTQESLSAFGLSLVCLCIFVITNLDPARTLQPVEWFLQALAVFGGSLILLSAFFKGGRTN